MPFQNEEEMQTRLMELLTFFSQKYKMSHLPLNTISEDGGKITITRFLASLLSGYVDAEICISSGYRTNFYQFSLV